jgi:pimeloyl-ACP methyl ester carboxylesterase
MYRKKRPIIVMAILSLLTLTLPMPAFASSDRAPRHQPLCQEMTVRVALRPDGPRDQTVAGTFCKPRWHKTKTVDVLVHGSTYNRSYWDFPIDNPAYSYVQQNMRSKSGRATFNYDQLGNGKSSRPVSTDVTMDAEAFVLHQIIQHFKKAKHYREVNVIGHSFGAMIGIREAANFKNVRNDVDRLVVTGSLQGLGPAIQNGEIQTYTAEEDPQFAGKGYDAGYRTVKPGVKSVFYHLPTADPDVIAYDEAHKDVISATKYTEGVAQRPVPAGSNLTNQVRVPVLLIDGQQDRLYCGVTLDCTDTAAVRAFHLPYYTNAANFKVVMIPDTGHDIALHPSAGDSFREIDRWLRATK